MTGELEKRIREKARLRGGFGASYSLDMSNRDLSDHATISVKEILKVLLEVKKAPNYIEGSPWFQKWFGE